MNPHIDHQRNRRDHVQGDGARDRTHESQEHNDCDDTVENGIELEPVDGPSRLKRDDDALSVPRHLSCAVCNHMVACACVCWLIDALLVGPCGL